MYALTVFLDDLQNNFQIHILFFLDYILQTIFKQVFFCGQFLAPRFDTTCILFILSCVSLVL